MCRGLNTTFNKRRSDVVLNIFKQNLAQGRYVIFIFLQHFNLIINISNKTLKRAIG